MTSKNNFPSDFYGLSETDLTRWRLKCDELGTMNWIYLKDAGADHLETHPPTNFTSYQLNLPTFKPQTLDRPQTPFQAAENCFKFLSYLQDPDSGMFPCQYGGPMFMLIGYVCAKYFTDCPFDEHEATEIIRYIVNRAHPVDGGWGLHTYDKSTCFGTSINYVILRILGLPADHPVMIKARKTLHNLGGALKNPHWGKGYMAILNLYGWEGVNPIPPELWLLPYSVPIHPGRWWVHTRAIYLPMGYLSANKVQKELNPLLVELRNELYTVPFESIDFSKHRNTVCGVDLYYPHTSALDTINQVLVFYGKYLRPDWMLKKASKYTVELIEKDLMNTDHLAIAPISNALSAIVMYLEHGKGSSWFDRFLFRWPDFLTMSVEGIMMNGTNGVQVWDVAFALQYCVLAGLAENPDFKDTIIQAYRFLLRSQFVSDCVEGSYRDHRNGAWPFSTQTQGFTVCDCTAEAIKAILMVQNVPGLEFLKDEISVERLYDGVDILLDMQNTDTFHFGSFATYEKIKGPEFIEYLNPAEVFGNIMVEFPYVECTDSSILGLVYFRKYFNYRSEEIDEAVQNALDYIISFQREDGSWYGSWGVCHTYAGMFAVEALSTQGYTYSNSETVEKACDFMVARQEQDGGWSEDFKSCELFTYVRHVKSEVVQTSWVLIMLLLGQYPDQAVIAKGISFLMSKQNSDGSYDWNHVEGVFNHSCSIEYPNYKFYFPMKAFGLYSNRYGRDATV